ncbi:hypothetical protein A2572_03880 [Candidatus Collierbacteria bacterium RIFOXYD1_FULL_40_9]|uniref:Phosphodiester glycosidase domain-containing protein n=1 Tax=Candidatus Collierbacteria bacterium RIFOXYD1_FULL_40_9 TaxID=1817731 RepID=A0A1F5FW36_9BACT|nr:MAG: hypothetical protein A2572_03880 [Candidatus Collierbacteria bacterium RIFOXYD1_FULL_40_9]
MNKVKNSKNQELENSNNVKGGNIVLIFITFFAVVGLALGAWNGISFYNKSIETLKNENIANENTFREVEASLSALIRLLEEEDLRKTNKEITKKMSELKNIFGKALVNYKDILEIEELGGKTEPLVASFAGILQAISKEDLISATTASARLSLEIGRESSRLKTLSVAIPKNVAEKQEAPGSGYSKQKVKVSENYFVVDIVAADLGSTKVIVDTASESTCTKDCPALPLATYVSRSGAYAGINGTYFCPETYPDCVDKKNSFDVLVMNENKTYFNSDNNVYSSVPAAIFSGSSARFVRESRSWGRDTGVDSVIANRPLLVLDGNVTVSTTDQNKENLRGNRGFLASKDSTVYIGIVRGASVGEAALVLKEMGIKNAINLDSGGSSALWFGGYKAGPGRNIPNAVLFVKK